jgi:hypothetical protein
MSLGVWNGKSSVHETWNVCQKNEEIIREGKLGITTPFDIIASDVCSEQETKTERETNSLIHA